MIGIVILGVLLVFFVILLIDTLRGGVLSREKKSGIPDIDPLKFPPPPPPPSYGFSISGIQRRKKRPDIIWQKN